MRVIAESGVDDGATHAKFAQHHHDIYPEEEDLVPRRTRTPLTLTMMACASVGLAAMLCMPFGWHSSDGGELQNYHLGLWQIHAAAYNNGSTSQDDLDARCLRSERTIECGTHSMFKATELGCLERDPSDSSDSSNSSRRLMSAEAFTEETWCGLWKQMQSASLIMLICGSCAVLFFWISICYGRSQLAVSSPWSKVFLFCLPPVSSTIGIIHYAVTTFDFPSSCKDGADFCGLFVVYGFGPAFWASSILTIFGFVPAIMAFAMMPDSSRDIDDWQNYGQDSFQPHYNQQERQNQQPLYAGYPQGMDQGLVQEGATEWRQTVRLHHEEMIVKRVKRGHCISYTIVFVAVFMIVGLFTPFGWHTSNGGATQKYFVGLWRIEVDPQNKDPETGHDIADAGLVENCKKKSSPPQLRCGAHMIWDVAHQGCHSPEDDSDWCKLWTQLYTSSVVAFICGCASVLFFIIGALVQCKFAYGARSLKLVFLSLAPAIAIGGLVYYFFTTKELPDQCTSAYSCNLLGFGPVFWGFALLSVYGLVPMFIVVCTSSAPLASTEGEAQENGMEMGQRKSMAWKRDSALESFPMPQEHGLETGQRESMAWKRDSALESFPMPQGDPMQAEFDAQLQQEPQQPDENNDAIPVDSPPQEEQTPEEEAPSAEPEPPAPAEPPKESWEDMFTRLAAAKKAKQEEEEAAKAQEEPPVQPPAEEPQQKASIVPEINVSVAPAVKPEEESMRALGQHGNDPPHSQPEPGAFASPSGECSGPEAEPQRNACLANDSADQVIARVTADPRICQLVDSHQSLQETQPSPGKVRLDLLSEQDDASGPQEKCANCGAVWPPGAKFCSQCGLNQACSKCGNVLAPSAKFCNACGASRLGASPKLDAPPSSTGVPLESDGGGVGSRDRGKGLRRGRDRGKRENDGERSPQARSPQPQEQKQPFRDETGHKSEFAKAVEPAKREYALPVPQGSFGGFRASNAPPKNSSDDDKPLAYPGAPLAPSGALQSFDNLPSPADALRSGPGSRQPPSQMGFGSQQQGFGQSALPSPAQALQSGPGSRQPPAQLNFGSQQRGFGQSTLPTPGYQQQYSRDMYGHTPQQNASRSVSPADQSNSQPRQAMSWAFMPSNAPGPTPSPQFTRTMLSPRDGYSQHGNGQPQQASSWAGNGQPQQPSLWGYTPGGAQTFSFVARH